MTSYNLWSKRVVYSGLHRGALTDTRSLDYTLNPTSKPLTLNWAIKGDTRSLDYSSYKPGLHCIPNLTMPETSAAAGGELPCRFKEGLEFRV